MRDVTGIELGADTCVLARVHQRRDSVDVSAVHGLQPDDELPRDDSFGETLSRIRRRKGFPRRARVVAWGLPESASVDEAATGATLSPLVQAGFLIDDVLRPPEALAVLARQRPRVAGREATAWLSLNRHAAAMAIVYDGELLFEREFAWRYRAGGTLREELLQRYSLVAHLAQEFRHAHDVIRDAHGVSVDGIVTCGDLPDLRSLTMPLIEELDIEVETLDSLDGIGIERPLRAEEIADKAPALRLALCAGIGRSIAPPRAYSRALPAAIAAAAVLAISIWGVLQFARRPPEGQSSSAALPQSGTPAQTQPAAPSPSPGSAPAQSAPAQPRLEEPPATITARAPSDGTVAEGTIGRQAAPGEGRSGDARGAAPIARSERPAATRTPAAAPDQKPPLESRPARGAAASARTPEVTTKPAPGPLKDPLPVVNSILVAPDRRLAVLDGAIVREGDAVGPRVLIRIEPGAVVLREPSGYEVRVPIRRRVGSI